jgi:hypothetical protein
MPVPPFTTKVRTITALSFAAITLFAASSGPCR